MALALTDVQSALADSVRDLASKRAPIAETRRRLEDLRRGDQGALWADVVGQGLHAVHLPESVDGMGGTVTDAAVAVETAGEVLLPGAFVPTIHASVLALSAGADEQVLARFAEGATATVVVGDLVLADDSISGTSTPALGLLAAEVLVVVVDGTAYLVDAEHARREQLVGVDLTRDLGTARFDGAPATRIGPVSRALLDAVDGAIWGAEAAGVARAAVAGAVDYAKTRIQFGVPIGSFQATKHKAARMAVAAELAASSAWGAALSIGQQDDQRAIAGAAAVLTAVKGAHQVVTDAVTIYGGIGFTWEHDAHLFLRRALSIAGTAEADTVVGSRLGAIALTTERTVEVDLPDEDPAFRAEISALLDEAAALPADEPRFEGRSGEVYPHGPRRDFLASKGLVAPHWPKPWGLGASPTEQVVIAQEFTAHGLAAPNTVIGEWAMPTVLAHGTEDQKERFGAPTLTGEVIWCQLFSEPGAGSDLAAVRTRAERSGDGWVLNGQKVWTSSAHQADWGICLARTEPDVPKHKGLTFFLVDMRAPGVTIRPLVQSNGEHDFNEVFLDGVQVPDANRVGEPGAGWRIALTTLQNERTAIGSSLSVGVERGLKAAIEAGAVDSPADALAALGRITARSTAIGSANLAETLRRLNGLQPGATSSIAKVATAELVREAGETGVRLAGWRTLLERSDGDPAMTDIEIPQQLIGGGTVEIQLNVIAERVLGLPRG